MAAALFSEMSHPHGDPNTGPSPQVHIHVNPHGPGARVTRTKENKYDLYKEQDG